MSSVSCHLKSLLGAVSRLKGNPLKAYLCYLKCFHLNPEFLESAITLAYIAIDLSRPDDAKFWANVIQEIQTGCEISDQIYEQIKE